MEVPHSPSPHLRRPSKVPFTLDGPTKDGLCSPGPLHSATPLPTPPEPVAMSSVATPFPETSISSVHSAPPMTTDEPSRFQSWISCCQPPLERALRNGSNDYYLHHSTHYNHQAASDFEYQPNGLPFSGNFNLTYPDLSGSACPRSYTGDLDFANAVGSISEMYHPPSAYLIEPQNSQDAAEPQDHAMSSQLLQMQFNDDYDLHCGANASPDDSGGYSSLIRSNTATRCSTPQDNGFGHARSDVSGEDGVIEKDQPYAQLIYRALMEAPSHTMILRDIYSWFKENTDKANDKETKGWQNSIRHNLSMNGAFEKVDQPGEEPRKGFMWKLTNEAIQEGVKSTTRYRSKQPNKRGHRMGQPQPQRQASGAKGGQAAKRSARLRHAHRMNKPYLHTSEPYVARSVPDGAYSPSFDFGSDMHMSSPASPFYASESDFGATLEASELAYNLPGPIMQPRPQALLPQETLCANGAYMSSPSDPQESLFYDDSSNTPSPDNNGPATPPPTEFDMMTMTYPTTEPFVFDGFQPDY